ncbi:DUF2231 domain-containing protein [Streptomyces sp. TS71-3]|uniref:DUF2231 domain-containing protein n=1 Tax=Streptomyces sp. TS71-3 TaxID=2733862 RepID=UPI001B0B6CFB|nr:DUF2231 domain-containing protein [Streptomyces sp. TS71-3]GHJ38500.1 hypothetical protein Sm713_41090 [Streptomyces sp. TS71-3]
MTVFNGLPAHVLFVHVVIVLVPLSALALVVCALWPQGARRLGVVLPVLALVTLLSVPVTTHAGEWLEAHVASNPLIRRHTQLGDGLLPWAGGLFLLAVAVWWTAGRRSDGGEQSSGAAAWAASVPVRVVAVVLSIVIATGSVVEVYRIGDSGAKAAWHGSFSKTALRHGGDD